MQISGEWRRVQDRSDLECLGEIKNGYNDVRWRVEQSFAGKDPSVKGVRVFTASYSNEPTRLRTYVHNSFRTPSPSDSWNSSAETLLRGSCWTYLSRILMNLATKASR